MRDVDIAYNRSKKNKIINKEYSILFYYIDLYFFLQTASQMYSGVVARID